MRLKRDMLVCVHWLDATYDGGVYDKDLAKQGRYEPVEMRTPGFVVETNKTTITVASESIHGKDGYEGRKYIHTIPRKYISKIVVIGDKYAL